MRRRGKHGHADPRDGERLEAQPAPGKRWRVVVRKIRGMTSRHTALS